MRASPLLNTDLGGSYKKDDFTNRIVQVMDEHSLAAINVQHCDTTSRLDQGSPRNNQDSLGQNLGSYGTYRLSVPMSCLKSFIRRHSLIFATLTWRLDEQVGNSGFQPCGLTSHNQG